MLPRVTIDTARVAGCAPLRLVRHGDDFTIFAGRDELMGTRMRTSEEALAQLAIARLDTSAPRVLIGGLGMGFTLRAALAELSPGARVTVVELIAAVVDWARGPLAHIHGDSLDDPRTTIAVRDVADAIVAGDWDAILLDVDNGPDALTMAGNASLYGAAGLARARRALRPGGVLAVWSAAPDARFEGRLRSADFVVETIVVRARETKGPRHTIWLARA